MIWLELFFKKAQMGFASAPVGEILWALFSMSSLAALLRCLAG